MPRKTTQVTTRRKQDPPSRYQPPPSSAQAPSLHFACRRRPPPPLVLARHPYFRPAATATGSSRLPSLSPTTSARPSSATSSVFSPRTPSDIQSFSQSQQNGRIRGWQPLESTVPCQKVDPSRPCDNVIGTSQASDRREWPLPAITRHTPIHDMSRAYSLPTLASILPHNPVRSLSTPDDSTLSSLPSYPPLQLLSTPSQTSTPFRPWLDTPSAPRSTFVDKLDSPLAVPLYAVPDVGSELNGFVPLKPTLGVLMESLPWSVDHDDRDIARLSCVG
jgi:hypothetical protein